VLPVVVKCHIKYCYKLIKLGVFLSFALLQSPQKGRCMSFSEKYYIQVVQQNNMTINKLVQKERNQLFEFIYHLLLDHTRTYKHPKHFTPYHLPILHTSFLPFQMALQPGVGLGLLYNMLPSLSIPCSVSPFIYTQLSQVPGHVIQPSHFWSMLHTSLCDLPCDTHLYSFYRYVTILTTILPNMQ